MRYANLLNAIIKDANLKGADLQLAVMPDGTTAYGTKQY
jgi:uncharacterized protein YjbI with pentapeptide repeats